MYMFVCIHIYIYIYIYVSIRVCIFTCMDVCVHWGASLYVKIGVPSVVDHLLTYNALAIQLRYGSVVYGC